ncbi:MAG: hypothetical protein K6E94_01405 [Elusimicrobiaceae bacterium]|nr:hypothetical protein [Elusimicrobiaceae bacterium]
MKKSLIIFIAALMGFSLPICAEDFFSSTRNMVLQGAQEGMKEDCAEDYVACANSISDADKKELIAELKNLDEDTQTELMISAVKRGKNKAVRVFLEAGILPDYNAVLFAKEKVINMFQKIDVMDKCIILSSAINDSVRPNVVEKVLEIFNEGEFASKCSAAGLVDNFNEANAKVLLDYVNGDADELHAYITLNGEDRLVTLLAYCIVNKVQETESDDNEKVINFLINNGADMQQELAYKGSDVTLQNLVDQYEEVGRPLKLY